MRRFNLVDGQMVEAEGGEYCLYSDVLTEDQTAAGTLSYQLEAIKAQIEAWNG